MKKRPPSIFLFKLHPIVYIGLCALLGVAFGL